MTFHCGVALYAYYCIFIFKLGPTECLTISTAEYIYPNTCNNITCNYESVFNDRTTAYTVLAANGSTLFAQNIVQIISSDLCLLGGINQCNAIGICWCDPNGLSTRICYNHTSGGEGHLTLQCASNVQNKDKLATIADIPSNVQPNNGIYKVNEGCSFGPLECNATCGPPCTFRWIGPASIINSSQFFLNPVARQENGTYQCEATNTIGTAHAHIDLIVKYGPNQVILSPNKTSLTLNEGDDVPDVTCTADCQPDCNLMWITPTGQVESNDILNLKNIKRTQAGTYLCNASNAISNIVSDGVTITVRYGPKKVTLSPNSTEYILNEGENVSNISCSAECHPACIRNWIGPKGHIFLSNELSLQNINRSQDGIYNCNATNVVSSMLSTDVEIIVNFGPSSVVLSPNKMKYTIKESESLQPSISCTATCQPHCVGTWTINTGEFVSYDNLSFPAINRNQTGSYRCNVSNSVSSMISTNVTVIVTYGAEIKDITINGGNFTIPENVETRITCEIDGVPKPNGMLFYNKEKKLRTENQIVYVMVPSCNDTGNYTCAAENSGGKANQTKELFVLCSPRPVVELPSKIAVGNDSILEINVIFFSYPQPKISWTFSKNGSNEKVSSIDTIGINQHISSIQITDIKTSQYGIYVLKVTNGIPDDFKHAFEVLPQRQPDIPTNFSASCDAPDSANLKWIPSFHGGDIQQFKLYYAVQDRQIVFIKHRMDIKENENELFTFERINGLLPETSYSFKLIAYNTFGDSNFINAYCDTTKTALEDESNIGLYIGASIGIFAAVLSIGFVVVVLYLRRKKFQGKRSKRNERLALADESEYTDEGLKDNILYESAESDLGQGTRKVGYEVNDKKRQNKHGTDNTAFQETALYNVVQKKTGQDGVSIKENKTKIDNGKAKKNNKKINKNEDVQEASRKELSKQNLNKDGLQYAELVFSKSTIGPKFVIRGFENRTIYAEVDTSQKIVPLPESDEDEPSDENTNNEESGI